MRTLFRKNGGRMGRRGLLSRRGLLGRVALGGAGALVGLPLFESLIGERAYADSAFPKRTVAYYVPNGIHMPGWTPTTTGSGYALTPILTPLAAVKEKINVISGLSNAPAKPEGAGDHAGGTSGFLTAAHANKSETDIQLGISIDQVIASAIGDQSPVASMQLGIDGGGSSGGCDSGYSCAYTRNISWASSTQSLSQTTSPLVVFNQIFGGVDPQATAEQQARRKLYRLSVLDYVHEEAKQLDGRLSAADRIKLDEYLTGINELEKRITSPAPSCDPVGAPNNNPGLVEHIQIMSDLMVLAMRCDTTRVISFMQANAASGRFYDFLPGVADEHHALSHHAGDSGKQAQLQTIDIWEVEQFAYFINALEAVQEGTSTLLDHCQVFFSSELEDGHSHGHRNLPIVVAGGCHDAYTTGRHIDFHPGGQGDGPPIANLFISMAAAMGVEIATFGETGTGPLGQLA